MPDWQLKVLEGNKLNNTPHVLSSKHVLGNFFPTMM